MDRNLLYGAAILMGGILFYRCCISKDIKSEDKWQSHTQEGLPEDTNWTVLTQGSGKNLKDVFLLNPH